MIVTVGVYPPESGRLPTRDVQRRPGRSFVCIVTHFVYATGNPNFLVLRKIPDSLWLYQTWKEYLYIDDDSDNQFGLIAFEERTGRQYFAVVLGMHNNHPCIDLLMDVDRDNLEQVLQSYRDGGSRPHQLSEDVLTMQVGLHTGETVKVEAYKSRPEQLGENGRVFANVSVERPQPQTAREVPSSWHTVLRYCCPCLNGNY